MVSAIVGAWIFTAGLSRVGMPPIDPTLAPVPRPLETLGVAALCLPISLHAALIRDHAPWLTNTTPRGAGGMRAAWLTIVVGFAALGSALWAVTNPDQISVVQAGTTACLLMGVAVISGHALRPDMSAVLPVVFVGTFSIPGLVPFGWNLVYNVSCLPALAVVTALASLTALMCVLRGHRDERYE